MGFAGQGCPAGFEPSPLSCPAVAGVAMGCCVKPEREYGKVLIGNQTPMTEQPTLYTLSITECVVSGTEGGPPQYSLQIRFDGVWFSVMDQNNDPENLLTLGAHPATGAHWDRISNHLSENSYSIGGIGGDEMEIVWDEIGVDGYSFTGEGRIVIKNRIEFKCPDSIWVGEEVSKGDPRYDEWYNAYCSPAAFFPVQTIYFRCEEGFSF
jgi:hypothetical protein